MDLNTLEYINEILEDLPKRFHKEFVEEVLFIENNMCAHDVRKIYEYYLEDIIPEMTEEEKSKIFVNLVQIEI